MQPKLTSLSLFAGIDISKDRMDVCYNNSSGEHHLKLSNNLSGFKELIKIIGIKHHYVMETTGLYYLKLASYLKHSGCKVSVENSLTIKRFIQMKNECNKNDKKDARSIFRYGKLHKPKIWKGASGIYMKCMQLQNAIMLLTKQHTMTTNVLHSIDLMPKQEDVTVKVLVRHLKVLTVETKELEKRLTSNIQSWVPEQLHNLLTIPGLGMRTVSKLIIFTNGFKKVNNFRQLISLTGLSPKEYSSGMSVKKRTRICKSGGSDLRNMLYMCSLSAIKKNKACKELYERLRARGKNGKIALIAVCNKLLKQAFAIAKSGHPYSEDYSILNPRKY